MLNVRKMINGMIGITVFFIACRPGGHYYDYHIGTTSHCLNHCYSIEDQLLKDSITFLGLSEDGVFKPLAAIMAQTIWWHTNQRHYIKISYGQAIFLEIWV